jgi:hypothetical protein
MQILDCRAGAVGWAGGKTEASVVRTEETAKCKKIKKIIWVAEPVRPGGLAARPKLPLGALKKLWLNRIHLYQRSWRICWIGCTRYLRIHEFDFLTVNFQLSTVDFMN